MTDEVINVRISPMHAAFLQANLSYLANSTRQAMSKPGINPDRRAALGMRAYALESLEDAVRGALIEPQNPRKSGRGTESTPRTVPSQPIYDYSYLSAP